MRRSLEEDLNELHRVKEWLIGGKRFVTIRYHKDTRELQYRHDFNEEQWIAMCEAHGEDPQSEAIEVPVPPAATRSTRQPWKGWTSLIAVYALKNRSIQPLVDALHPNPSSVNVDEHYDIRDKNSDKKNGIVTDLRVAAEKLARLVRDGDIGSGRPLPVVSREHLEIKLSIIDPMRDQGYTYKQILDELKDLGFPTEPKPGAEDKALDLPTVKLLGGLDISDFDTED